MFDTLAIASHRPFDDCNAAVQSNGTNGGFMRFAIACLFLAISDAALCGESCGITRCKVGDRVVTHASRSEPLVGCKTKDLAAYASFALGLRQIGTTEDTVIGETAAILKMLRVRADVANLNDALAKRSCMLITARRHVRIIEYPKDDNAMHVAKIAPSKEGGLHYWTIFMGLDSE